MAAEAKLVFDTDRRIRLGIWGLGRGMHFYSTCDMLNVDVVAGCDYNEHMRDRFLESKPDAFATADADEFLKQDFDAVLLATFCPAHCDDAIKCLEAGKHVLSEVTAFHTMAEGVRLVEAVETSGRTYNLAENYPFSPRNMYLASKWREGLFGELMYAEYEYVHECRSLSYTYIDGVPIQPGNHVHTWRSWQNSHYYCTHSLGPVMVITGERPTSVVSLPTTQRLAGYLPGDKGCVAPSLITMSNGGVVRNLMGPTTNDTHVQRIWGTLGAAEQNTDKPLNMRLGGTGHSPKLEVEPEMCELAKMAADTGHGGGDFWMIYYFVRQILTGEEAPFDIYSACDVTIPGILAYRSSKNGGRVYEVPDFRDKGKREEWRDDQWSQTRYTSEQLFDDSCDKEVTLQFSKTMADIIRHSTNYRAFADWAKVEEDIVDSDEFFKILERVALDIDDLVNAYAAARMIVDACPGTDAAGVLAQMLEVGEEQTATSAAFRKQILTQYEDAKQQRCTPETLIGEVSQLYPATAIQTVGLPDDAIFTGAEIVAKPHMLDIRPVHGGEEGVVYLRFKETVDTAAEATLHFGVDAPVKIWVNGRVVACEPEATCPALPDQYQVYTELDEGENTITLAMGTDSGKAWGAMLRIQPS